MSGHVKPRALFSEVLAFFLPSSSRVLYLVFVCAFEKKKKKTGIEKGIALISTEEAWAVVGGKG